MIERPRALALELMTLPGLSGHEARLSDALAARAGLASRRSAHTGVLTDASNVQPVGRGVRRIDLGFPMRYSHVADRRGRAGA
jgi:putative aminopeptidase FrvX